MDGGKLGELGICGVTFAAVGFLTGIYIGPHVRPVPIRTETRTVYVETGTALAKLTGKPMCGWRGVWWPARKGGMCFTADMPPGLDP